mmetsp:Transcript_30764/g.95661  ORF Transcript_30764/g.95661 Transcript_30764/m.95661 type:complete len:229 (-) Transcript_30764:67-753(-)
MAACTRAAAFFTLCVASNLAFFELAFSSAAVEASIAFLASSRSMSSTCSKSFTRMESWLESTLAKPPKTTRGFHVPACLYRSTPTSSAVIMGAWFASTPSWPLALGSTTSDTDSVTPRPSGERTLSCTRSAPDPEPSSAWRAVWPLRTGHGRSDGAPPAPEKSRPQCRARARQATPHNSLGRTCARAIAASGRRGGGARAPELRLGAWSKRGGEAGAWNCSLGSKSVF